VPIDDPVNVVCFGGEDWWYHNRAHVDMQLARRFAKRGRALYVNSIVMRRFNVGEGTMFLKRVSRKLASLRRGLVEAEQDFFVHSPLTLPVHHIPGANWANQTALAWQVRRAMRKLRIDNPVIWVACPAACEAALRLPRRALAYQRADRMELYPGADRNEVRKMDRTLKREADVTLFVNHALYEAEKADCRRSALIDHGVDYDLFAGAEADARVPADMKGFRRPIVGFFGGIDDHTSDVPLVADVARRRPDYTFVFVGSVSADLAPLEGLSNCHFLGKRNYEEVPHYGKCFDVAIMPWRENQWIEMCNPIKLKEYLALGKPVVSTPFRELEYYEGCVYVARGPRDFAAALDRAIAEDNAERRAARRDRVRDITWEAEAQAALRAIDEGVRAGNENE